MHADIKQHIAYGLQIGKKTSMFVLKFYSGFSTGLNFRCSAGMFCINQKTIETLALFDCCGDVILDFYVVVLYSFASKSSFGHLWLVIMM